MVHAHTLRSLVKGIEAVAFKFSSLGKDRLSTAGQESSMEGRGTIPPPGVYDVVAAVIGTRVSRKGSLGKGWGQLVLPSFHIRKLLFPCWLEATELYF